MSTQYERPADEEWVAELAEVPEQWEMDPGEQVAIDVDQPILLAETTKEVTGIYAPVVADIQMPDAGFYILDTRESLDFPETEFVIVTDDYSKPGDPGILMIPDNETITFGRNHHTEIFNYSDGVSGDHFQVSREEGNLYVRNLDPTNYTELTAHELAAISPGEAASPEEDDGWPTFDDLGADSQTIDPEWGTWDDDPDEPVQVPQQRASEDVAPQQGQEAPEPVPEQQPTVQAEAADAGETERPIIHYEKALEPGTSSNLDPLSDDLAPVLTAEESMQRFGIDAVSKISISHTSSLAHIPDTTEYLYKGEDVNLDTVLHSMVLATRSDLHGPEYLLVSDQFDRDTGAGCVGIKFNEKGVPQSVVPGTDENANWNMRYGVTLERYGYMKVRRPQGTDSLTITREFYEPDDRRPEERLESNGIDLDAIPEKVGVPEFRVGVAESKDHGEDSHLIMPEEGVFGVFDGMGSGLFAKDASRQAGLTIGSRYLNSPPPTSVETNISTRRSVRLLCTAMQDASNTITEKYPDDASTGIVGQLLPPRLPDAAGHVIWANAGDSRLYLIRAGQLTQISKDEGRGNILANKLGRSGVVEQAGHFAVYPGDRLLFVTDGVTGDSPDEVLSDDEILAAGGSGTPEEASHALVDVARKLDDRTAVTVDIP